MKNKKEYIKQSLSLSTKDIEKLDNVNYFEDEDPELTIQTSYNGYDTLLKVKSLLEAKYGRKIEFRELDKILSVVLKDMKVHKGRAGYGYGKLKASQLNAKGRKNRL